MSLCQLWTSHLQLKVIMDVCKVSNKYVRENSEARLGVFTTETSKRDCLSGEAFVVVFLVLGLTSLSTHLRSFTYQDGACL